VQPHGRRFGEGDSTARRARALPSRNRPSARGERCEPGSSRVCCSGSGLWPRSGTRKQSVADGRSWPHPPSPRGRGRSRHRKSARRVPGLDRVVHDGQPTAKACSPIPELSRVDTAIVRIGAHVCTRIQTRRLCRELPGERIASVGSERTVR
jgi:hypothetical protein